MRPFWHPLSTILLDDPRCWATSALLRMFLRPGGTTTLVYAGDRMWPTLRHGEKFDVDAGGADELEPGDAVLASVDGVPDLLRVESVDGDRLCLVGDSCPERFTAERDAVFGRARLDRSLSGLRRRSLRRFGLDLAEAWRGRPESAADPAATVLAKYDAQAEFYARGDDRLEPSLDERVREAFRPGGKILVIGSGAGNECFALARHGFDVSGVDFSPAMVEHSRKQAAQRELEIDFETADVRGLTLEPRSLDGILFTYDVYSFLPERRGRIEALSRLGAALRPDGSMFLSARACASAYQGLILTLLWLAARGKGPGEWGGSHTRWIDTDGSLQRSFVHVFSKSGLDHEVRAAGLSPGEWRAGHARLGPPVA